MYAWSSPAAEESRYSTVNLTKGFRPMKTVRCDILHPKLRIASLQDPRHRVQPVVLIRFYGCDSLGNPDLQRAQTRQSKWCPDARANSIMLLLRPVEAGRWCGTGFCRFSCFRLVRSGTASRRVTHPVRRNSLTGRASERFSCTEPRHTGMGRERAPVPANDSGATEWTMPPGGIIHC